MADENTESNVSWEGVKPKDVFLDPGFYRLSKESRRSIASKVEPQWNKFTPEEQDAALDAPQSYWEEYFKPEPVEEPSFFEKARGAIGAAMGHIGASELGIGDAMADPREKPKKETPPALPLDFGKPPVIDDLVKMERMARKGGPPPAYKEESFQKWYKGWAQKAGIDPNPDHPLHKYDYRAAYRAGVTPSIDPKDGMYHWPSEFKADDHPNRYVNGIDTKTGKPVSMKSGRAAEGSADSTDTLAKLDISGMEFSETLDGKIVAKKKEAPEVEIIDGIPYRKIKPVVSDEARKAIKQEDITRERLELMRRGYPVSSMPSDRPTNAIVSLLQGVAQGLPAMVKSAASAEHMWNMVWGIDLEAMESGESIPIPKLEDSWLWKTGQQMQEKINNDLPVNPRFQNEYWANLIPQGIGSTTFFLGAAAIGGAMGLPTRAATATAGAGVQLGPMYEEAYFRGAAPKELFATALAAIGLGISEAAPIERQLARLNKISGGFVERWVRNRMIAAPTLEGMKGWLEEFGQEWGQSLGQEWVQSHIGPRREPNYDDALRQGIAGGAAGAAFSALLSSIGVANARMRMKDSFAARRDQIQARLQEAGLSKEEIATHIAALKSQEKQFIRQLEKELSESERSADTKLQKNKDLTGTEAVMIMKPETGAVISIQSKEDYDRAKKAEIASLMDVPTEEIDRMMQGERAPKEAELPQEMEEAPGEIAPVSVAPFVTGDQLIQLNKEVEEFSRGQRAAVIIPRGADPIDRKTAIANAGPVSRVFWSSQGAVIYDPKKISTDDIQQMIQSGRQEELTALEPQWPHRVYDPSKWDIAPESPAAPEPSPVAAPEPEGAPPAAPLASSEFELPIGKSETERRTATRPGATDRRKDLARRKQVSLMSREEIEKELLTDELTGLRNRSAWERAPFMKFVASLDLDKMKRINDVYGQEQGDKYLQHAAQGFMQSGVPVYRLGGDDFVAKASSREEIDAAMAKVEDWFSKNPLTINGEQVNVGFSYGVEESPEAAFKEMKKRKAASIAQGKIEQRYEAPAELPAEIGAAPAIEETPLAPPVPEGKDPFNWYADLGFEANGARKTAVGEFVWTPLGVGQVMEEEEDNPLPEGVISVGFGSKSRRTEEFEGGNYDFNVRDTILLDKDDPKFYEDDYVLPAAPKGLKISPDTQYKGMNPQQVYLSIRESQAARLFALKRAEYIAEPGQLPGWRASNIRYLTQEYDNGYMEAAKVFGPKVSQSMKDDLEIPMDRALGIKQPPHIESGRLPKDIEFVGLQDGKFGYIDKKIQEEGAPESIFRIQAESDDDLEELVRSRRELWNEEKEARLAAQESLKKIQRAASSYEIQKPEIEAKLSVIRDLERTMLDPTISDADKREPARVLDINRRLYEGMWAQVIDESGEKLAAEERRKLEAQHPAPLLGELPQAPKTPGIPKTKVSGPLSGFFESVATIDPKIFNVLNVNLNRAEDAGIADDIMLGLIAGKKKEDIAKDIFGSHAAGTVPSIINLKVMVAAIKQLKGIPDIGDPAFASWQDNAFEILKGWEKVKQPEPLPPEMPPAPEPVPEPEAQKTPSKRHVAEKKPVIVRGPTVWEVDYTGTPQEPEIVRLFKVSKIPTAYGLTTPVSEVWESLRSKDPDTEFDISDAEMTPAEPPIVPPKDINDRPTQDDGASRYGFGVKVIKGSLQLLLSSAQREALFNMEFERAETILLQRIFKANEKDPRIAKELSGILNNLKEDHAAKLAQNKPADPIPPAPTEEQKAPVTVNEPAPPAGPEAVAPKETDAIKKIRERMKAKLGARGKMEMATPEAGAAPTAEEMLNDPEILDIMTDLGNEFHGQGITDKAQWHASMYAELEAMAEGLGRDLESLFGMAWNAITDEEGYEGGIGGVYGAKEKGYAGPETGGVPANAGETGVPHGGVQPPPVEGFGGLGPAPGIPGGEVVTGETNVPGVPEGGDVAPVGGGSGGPATVSGGGAKPRESGRFFEYTPEVKFGEGGWEGKLEQNLDAVRLVKQLQQEGRQPTDEEKLTLARFIGWGALWRVFDPKHYKYAEQRAELRRLLSDEEYKRAMASTQNAHYTAEPIARALWKIADRLGFGGGGAVLEGAAGVGVILGTAPDHIANTSQFFGTELDPITAAIAGYLYPAARIFPRGFENLEFPDNTVDLAISNVPFGGNVFDKRYDSILGKNPAIHDYYFLKTVDKLRPGGILIYITSIYTMDKQADQIRRMVADKADLVHAFRLPNGAFMSNAGTGVATDIIVLQKRLPGQESNGISWAKTDKIEVPDTLVGGTARINLNEYYQQHPENILGSMAQGRGQNSNQDPIVVPPAGMKQNIDLTNWVADQIEIHMNRVPPGIYQPAVGSNPRETVQFMDRFADSSVWEKQIVIDENGKLMRKVDGFMQPLEPELADIPVAVEMITDLVGIRESLWEVFRTQLSTNDDEVLKISQQRLEAAYDSFIAKWRGSGTKNKKMAGGNQNKILYLNDRKVKAVYGADPSYYFLISLEEVNQDDGTITKSPIFTERSMRPSMPLESLPDDARQAMLMVYANRGFLDLDLMAKLTNKTADEWEQRLKEEKLIFKNPVTGVLELAEDYLSGDVYDKIEAAENGLPLDPALQLNIDALKEVIPNRVLIANPDDPKQVFEARLGASWIPDIVYEDFIRNLFENDDLEITIGRSKAGGYTVSIKGDLSDYIRLKKWGTDRKPAEQLIVLAMNQKKPVVYDEVDDRLVRNPVKTKEAQLVQTRVREEFVKWARIGPHSKSLEEGYNRAFNRIRLRQYDGSHLTFEGMNRSILRHAELEPHQRNAVWRIILEGRALLAHFVGSGKTFEMAAAAMEMRRMGLVNKNMISVPKNIYRQFGADFARLYPGAKLLVVDEKDFEAKHRKKLFARIAMEDWDAVIISHEQLAKIPMSPERMSRMINEEIDELEEQIKSLGKPANKQQQVTLKQLQKRLDDYRAQLQHLLNLRQDDTVYFDQMGVDMLMVDEAHAYKSLPILTSMGQIAGLGGQSSKRALTLKAKTDYLLEKNNGRGVVFATGTPVSNSMVELYNFNKFLDPAGLRNAGVKRFDSWAANFGEVKLIVGISADGRSLRPQTVFGEFTNLPELQQMFRKYADVITRDMINLPIPEQINEKGEPDKPTLVKVTPDAATDEYFEEIKKRLEYIDRNPNHDRHIDNILKIMNDARLASLDMRLIGSAGLDNPDSKANRCIRMMAEYYKDHLDDRRTQVAFTGNFRNSETGFNLYDDMKAKLIAAGVPSYHIAVIHDYKSDEDIKNLYKQMREGQIRVLLTTKKTSEGANIQARLGRLYHLDAPWTPKEIEQREGRILRQGNLHHQWGEPVQIIQFVTERTLDSRLFEILRRKARFIRQYLKGDSNVRKAADPAAKVVVTFEMISAEASGNPEYLVKVQLEQQVADLEILRERHLDNQRTLENDLNIERNHEARSKKNIAYYESAIADFEKQREPFSYNIDGQDFTDPDAAVESVRKKKETGVPNPKIAEGKQLDPGEPEIVPYKPFASGRYMTPEEAIAKINYRADPANRNFKFNAVIAGKRHEKEQDAETALVEAALAYKNVLGDSTIDFELYGFPAKLTLHLSEHTQKDSSGKLETVQTRWVQLKFLQESRSIESAPSAVKSMVHALHDMKRRVTTELSNLERIGAEIARIREAMGKPWDQQEEYEEAVEDLREVNKKLGLGDPDEEGSVSTEETGEVTDVDEGGDENPDPEEEDGDDEYSETSDQLFDMVSPYREIGVAGSGSIVQTAIPEEEAEEDLAAREPKKIIKELPMLPKEAEYGPEFLYSQPLDQATIDAFNKGQVSQDLLDNLKNKANRRLAKIQRVSPMVNDAGWEISDGITLLQFYKTEDSAGNKVLQAWDALSYGRIQIPELLWLIKEITGKDMGLSKRLRTALGHFVPDDAGGLIEVRPDLAYELKDREQLARTLAHELGHAIDFAPDSDMAKGNLIGRLLSLHRFMKQTFDLNGTKLREKTFRDELTALSDYWRPWDKANAPKWFITYRASAQELYADFLSAILNSPGTAARLAPTAYRLWTTQLDAKPDVKEAYLKVRFLMEGTQEQLLDHRAEKMTAMFRASEDIENLMRLNENTRAYSWYGGLREEFDDRRWELKQRQRRAQKSNSYSPTDDANPMFLWDEMPNKLQTLTYRHLEKIQDSVVKPLEAKGMSHREIDEYIFLHRVATERKNMFNPIVGLGEYAHQSLDHMKKVLGNEKFALVEKGAKMYHDMRWDLVLAAMESGIYSKDLVEKVFEPAKYSYGKFTPIEYVKDWVSPHVQEQTGFAGQIAGPFTETLKMDRALIYLTARNNAVKASLQFLREFYPDEIKPAKRSNPGAKGRPEYHGAPDGYGLVEVMEDGKSAGYYVDQHMADSFNNISPERVDSASRILQYYNMKYFWKVAILYNFGFGSWGNPGRDFGRNFRLLPLKTAIVGDLFQLLGGYAKATPHAFKWLWRSKHSDAMVNEMIDSYSYAMPLSDLGVQEEDPFLYELKRAGIVNEIGLMNRSKLANLFYRGLQIVGSPMKFMMSGLEMSGKLVGYNIRKQAGEAGKELAYNVRNFTSTPNYEVKGAKSDTTNAWLIFSTIMKESWKSEYLCATDPKTRSGYWFRTSKLLFLKVLTVLAELGALNYFFGDDLEKKYKSAGKYSKRNYLLIPWGQADESGRVGFIPLPQDEMTRLLGCLLRDIIISAKSNDPRWYEDLVKDITSNFLPSFSPAVTSAVGVVDFFKGTNFIDGFRQTPMFSDTVQKARGWERNKRMLLWLLNENGLGQFATYDDSRKTKYQSWVQYDPVVGRLFGRAYKVTNYGLVEEEKDQLWMNEHMKAREKQAREHATPTVRRFYDEKYSVLRHHTLTATASARGENVAGLIKEYPDAIWFPLYDKSARAINVLQKQIEVIDKDAALSEKEKSLKKVLVRQQMDGVAKEALLKSGKIKQEELPREFGQPPEKNEE